jgi:hypothetical protein
MVADIEMVTPPQTPDDTRRALPAGRDEQAAGEQEDEREQHQTP